LNVSETQDRSTARDETAEDDEYNLRQETRDYISKLAGFYGSDDGIHGGTWQGERGSPDRTFSYTVPAALLARDLRDAAGYLDALADEAAGIAAKQGATVPRERGPLSSL
jgi:hypothetical protein